MELVVLVRGCATGKDIVRSFAPAHRPILLSLSAKITILGNTGGNACARYTFRRIVPRTRLPLIHGTTLLRYYDLTQLSTQLCWSLPTNTPCIASHYANRLNSPAKRETTMLLLPIPRPIPRNKLVKLACIFSTSLHSLRGFLMAVKKKRKKRRTSLLPVFHAVYNVDGFFCTLLAQ